MALLLRAYRSSGAVALRRAAQRPAARHVVLTPMRQLSDARDHQQEDDNDEEVSIAGTKTFDNLREAFSRKAMAMARYEYFAQKADVEGLTEAAQALRAIASSAREQAFGHMEFLEEVDNDEESSSTEANIESCVADEQSEYEELYPRWAGTAYEENISDVGTWMESLRDTSLRNMNRLLKMQQVVEEIYKLEGEDAEGAPNGAETAETVKK